MSGVDFEKHTMMLDLADKNAKVYALIRMNCDFESISDGNESFLDVIGVFDLESEAKKAKHWMEKHKFNGKHVYAVKKTKITKWKGE